MNIRITDLLDDYAPDELPFASVSRPTARRTTQLVLQRLGAVPRKKRPVRRVVLAAACIALLAAAVLAGALGLRQLARADLGVTNPSAIPEYTEYAEPGASSAVTLVSSFCAGKRLIAYVEVPNVTKDMADTYAFAWETYGQSLWSCRARPYSVWAEQLSYDETAQTALLRVELNADEALPSGEISVELCFDTLEDSPDAAETGLTTTGPVFAAFSLPVSPSKALSAAPGLAVLSDFLGESAVLRELSLDAGTLHVTLQTPTLEAYLSARGEGSLEALVNGYFGESDAPDLLDAQVAYRRSWNQAANDFFADAQLVFSGGTKKPLSALFRNEVCPFSPEIDATQEDAGVYCFAAELSSPAALEDVLAMEVAGQEVLMVR